MGINLIAALVLVALVSGLIVGRSRVRFGSVLLILLLAGVGAGALWFLRSEGDSAIFHPPERFEHRHQEIRLVTGEPRPALPTHIVVRSGLAKLKERTDEDYFSVERSSKGTIRWEVRGIDWKNGHQAALEHAIDTARALLAVHFRDSGADADWLPSRGDVERLVGKQVSYEDRKFEGLGPLNRAEVLSRAEVKFELTSADYHRFFRGLRLQESAQREWLFTKGLLGVLALLGAVSGYFRLDERTKGYYTGWLRVGAVAFLAAAGVGISMLP